MVVVWCALSGSRAEGHTEPTNPRGPEGHLWGLRPPTPGTQAWCSPVPGGLELLPALTQASVRPSQASASAQTHCFWKLPVTET